MPRPRVACKDIYERNVSDIEGIGKSAAELAEPDHACEYVKEHDQKGRGSSQAIQHFNVFFSTTRTVDSNGNIYRTVPHNSGAAPFSMFQRTTRLVVRGVLSEELAAST